MRRRFLLILAGLVIPVLAGVTPRHRGSASAAPSPYAGQVGSPLRGLSQQEIDDLLNGRGHGFARMAELNGYPGPLHALELKRELDLSAEQTARVAVVFKQMQADAKRVGQDILNHERALSDAFAHRSITQRDLGTRVDELAALYGRLRAVHLQAHLAITPLLSAEQITTYNRLRGYDGTPPGAPDTHPGAPGGHPGH